MAAAAVAAVAWTGLGVQFAATFAGSGSIGTTLWVILRFFTITTNIAVALLFSAIALNVPAARSPRLMGGVTLAMLLVGIIYNLLLRGLIELSGGAQLANTLLHVVTPILVPLYWLFFTPKGALRHGDPWLWTIYPMLYVPYALGRGLSGDIYAYPFINVSKLGWGQVMLNVLLIAIGFIVAGHLFVLLDRWLAKLRRSGQGSLARSVR